MKLLFCIVVVLTLFKHPARACSAFMMPDSKNVVVGRNFDWSFDHGLILVNKRGMAKVALAREPNTPAKWTSKYGSITFNQVARELPQGGVNEKGLVIEVLWLDSAEVPAIDKRPTLNELQWIQYQLDNFSSVNEVITHINDVRIAKAFANVHYFACDPSRFCATIEPLAGNMIIHSNETLPKPQLTNNAYEESLSYSAPYSDNIKCKSVPIGNKSLDRFARASCLLSAKQTFSKPTSLINQTFKVLDHVAQGANTKWSIVYDLSAKTVTLRTRKAKKSKMLNMSDMDFSCKTPVKMIDINSANIGLINDKLKDFSTVSNKKIIEQSLVTGFAHLPEAMVEKLANYPQTTVCTE